MLKQKGIKINIVVDKNRYRGGMVAIKELGSELIILDDGFQHRKLYRDLDLVLIKKKDLKDKLLPFGRLREPFSALKRADAILLTYQEIEPFEFSFKNKPIFKIYRENWKVLDCNFKEVKIERLKNKEIVGFCGLGDSDQFFKIVKNLGIKLTQKITFPDHYSYKNFKLDPRQIYLTTLKDGIKLPPNENIYFLNFNLKVEGLEKFILEKI